jgi:polar amino acid transport system substrate-binding protein
VELPKVLQEAVMVLHDPIQRHTDAFSLALCEDPPPIRGNPQQLEQVFINVILNALQALPDRGRAVRVRCRADPEGGALVVEVSDAGAGIAEADLARVAEPFFTTRTARGGTGLGLSISKSIVDRHGGTLTFASRPGEGTTVTIRLPTRAAGRPT